MNIEWDADQSRALARLSELVDRHGRPAERGRGVYLHGRPGRGKTMVMDRFYASVRSDRKRRFHFHDFFARLHAAAHDFRSIDKGIDRLLGGARLVCFDEFHVHDIGDAMLIARLLDALFARHIVLVVTSNYPPGDLLPNPLFHDRFEPTIARIVEHLDVLSVDGPIDYRTRATHDRKQGFGSGHYVVGEPSVVEGGGAQPVRDRAVEVSIGPRTVRARAVDGGTVAFEFAALCGIATSAADYVELARRFQHWTLCSVPPLREVPADWVMRFVNLVDVLYDADLALTMFARVPLAELGAQVVVVPDLARTLSRLGELSQISAVPVGQYP
ncbi:cell division protein ZapE [Nocardia goodfellowii]|uniref:Cell division protein ZapE n=1 Tax=Nocardia goodfellowii TaxID=882446 RepID=A0ABS4Q7U7_9NOCA|nr:cell division protein ZapE [Nocardia goodfellowii]MBP2187762.1 cell division protein ZapE [Nocardia goodfellowii]